MLVLDNRCKVCAAIRADKQLLKRIYNSSWYLPHSKDSLIKIATEYKSVISYQSLVNHVKKHQFIDSQDYSEKMLQHQAKLAEKSAVQKAVKAVDAVQTVIDRGMQRLEDGEITVDTNQLIRASQVKLTHESKTKDQELATIEMVAHFLSGENREKIYVDSSVLGVPDETN